MFPAAEIMATNLQLMDKPGTKSLVWDYFGVEKGRNRKPTDTEVAYCRSCQKWVPAKNCNMSNLLAHLRVYHQKVHGEVTEAMRANQPRKNSKSKPNALVGQPLIQESFQRSQNYERKGKRWKEITDAVTYCISKDSLPLYTVEKPGFKTLVRTLDSHYEIPSRSHFSKNAIPSLYATTVDKVREDLSSIEYSASTTDLWSSVGMIPYLSCTIHFIDSCWELRCRCLQTQFLPKDHTGIHIAEAMESTLDSWGLSEKKQICLTTDNGSNIVNAAEQLKFPVLVIIYIWPLLSPLKMTKDVPEPLVCVTKL